MIFHSFKYTSLKMMGEGNNNLKYHLRLEREQQTKFKRGTKNEDINISVDVNKN